MDELNSVLKFAESRGGDEPVTREQFVGLVKRVRTELSFLRDENTSLRRRVEQLEQGGTL